MLSGSFPGGKVDLVSGQILHGQLEILAEHFTIYRRMTRIWLLPSGKPKKKLE